MNRTSTSRTWRALPLFILIASLVALSCQLTNSIVSAPDTSQLAQAEEVIVEPTETLTLPTALPTTTPTLRPPTPAAINPQGNCTNSSAFLADVTIPDGTVIASNQTFTKTWRLSNPTGKCAWGPGYQLIFVSGTAMTSKIAVAIPDTPSSGTADVLVPMTAPSQPGNYSGTWQLKSPNGALFGVKVSVKITTSGAIVVAAPTQTATTANTRIAALATQTVTPSPTPQATSTVNPGTSTTSVTRNSMAGTESGTVYATVGGPFVFLGEIIAGDLKSNLLGHGYMSFDISDLSSKTIVNASLDLTSCTIVGTPFSTLGAIWIAELQYPLPLVNSDDAITDTGIVQIKSKPTSSIDVKSWVQNRVSQRKTRFQLRLHSTSTKSDGNKQADYFSCMPGVPKLKITYQ